MKRVIAASALAVAVALGTAAPSYASTSRPATTTTKPTTTKPPATVPTIVAVVSANNGDSSDGGYILYSNRLVVPVGGAQFFGDARKSRLNDFVGLAQDGSDSGYWLVTRTGRAIAEGSVGCTGGETWTGPGYLPAPIIGVVNAGVYQGYAAVTANGQTYTYSCQYSF
jgi:hypothetical protein